MKINKKGISVLLSGILMSGMLVGCSSEIDTTEGLTDLGKENIARYKEEMNFDKLDEITFDCSNDKDYIKIVGKVDKIGNETDTVWKICLHAKNSTPYPLYIMIPKHLVDVKFKENDTITVYGRLQGLLERNGINCWVISGYYIELGDTTNKEKTIKKDDVEAKVNEEKEVETAKEVEVTKDKEKEKAPSQDNNKSNEKQIDTKKDNDNSTKEEPKKKDTNTKKDTKEEHRGYYVTCPNGHKIYTENGDWDCIECDDDWQEQEEPDNSDYEDEEYEDGYIKDGTHLGENNPDESIEVIEDPEYYE